MSDASLRRIALVEATTLVLLLFVAVPLKHLAHVPLAVAIVGPLHGMIFVAYCWSVVETGVARCWPRGRIVRLLAAAFVPFGGLATALWLDRRARERATPS